jgi:hypothetical protein
MIWHATFKDGSSLCQYDDQKREVQFRKVLDRLTDLKTFSISWGKYAYTVSLSDGMFTIKNIHMYILDTNIYPPNELENIRPIYFERWQQDFEIPAGRSLGQKLLFTALGFQALCKGKNVKRYLEVYHSGDVKVREK